MVNTVKCFADVQANCTKRFFVIKDGVRGSWGGFNSTHLNARISLNTYDIKTYDAPKNSWFPCLFVDITSIKV